jgi:hypothetical protein
MDTNGNCWHSIWLAMTCFLTNFSIEWWNKMGMRIDSLRKRHLRGYFSVLRFNLIVGFMRTGGRPLLIRFSITFAQCKDLI